MRCNQHGGSFCYIEAGSTTHIRLSSGDLGIWATAIINDAATLSCPPHTVEFDKILYPKKKLPAPTQNIAHVHEDPNKPIIHYHLLPPTIAATAPTQEDSSSPKKKRRRSTTTLSMIRSSPIPGFEVLEYNSKGLYAYLQWCTKKYGDCEFMDAYESLAKEKMGIDVMLAVSALDLHSVCKITFGTAVRIIHCYPKWLLELKSIVIHLYMTVSELILSNLWRNDRRRNFKNFVC